MDAPVVLIVEDEPELAALYGSFLEDACRVVTAHTGEEALEVIDHSIDVALLDRMLDEWSGSDLLAVIHERNIDCGTVMVTAKAPDFDIVDIPVDEYLTKPVFREDLRHTVEEIVYRMLGGYDKREFLALISRKIALEREKSRSELDRTPEYRKLKRRIRIANERLDLRPYSSGSTKRPSTCPDCDFRWDVAVDNIVGYVELSSWVWKCTRCGNVVNMSDPSDRFVAR